MVQICLCEGVDIGVYFTDLDPSSQSSDQSASIWSFVALFVWSFLTTIHLPAFIPLLAVAKKQRASLVLRRPCPSRHSAKNPIQAWPRLASSTSQLPGYLHKPSTLRRLTPSVLNRASQANIGGKTHRSFLPPRQVLHMVLVPSQHLDPRASAATCVH
jgi:hypothetical protein